MHFPQILQIKTYVFITLKLSNVEKQNRKDNYQWPEEVHVKKMYQHPQRN